MQEAVGKDLFEPFLNYKERGVFLLCKTSNPGARDLQDLTLTPTPFPQGAPFGDDKGQGVRTQYLHEYIAHLAQTWNTWDNIGLVVGTTQPEVLARVRAAAPDLWFLSPGVGAQGGDLA